MLVEEFLERLSRGPLTNLSLANEGDGTINPDKIPGIIMYTNEALLRLYSTFNLAEKELILELQEDITSYKLHSKYAYTKVVEGQTFKPYIVDAVHDPFIDDLIKVLQVKRSGGVYLALNNDGVPGSLYTPTVNVLQVPDPWPGVPLFVEYQAMHAKLLSTGDFMRAEIELPAVLEDAALSYVAHKVFLHMGGQEHGAKSAEHLAMFKAVTADVLDKDLVSSSLSQTNVKFYQRGFV